MKLPNWLCIAGDRRVNLLLTRAGFCLLLSCSRIYGDEVHVDTSIIMSMTNLGEPVTYKKMLNC